MITTKENGTQYTGGLTRAVIDWHISNGMTICYVTRPLSKDTEGEYIDDITQLEVDVGYEKIRELLYKEEADALYFKVQRGEILEQVWLDKVAEIKAMYVAPLL